MAAEFRTFDDVVPFVSKTLNRALHEHKLVDVKGLCILNLDAGQWNSRGRASKLKVTSEIVIWGRAMVCSPLPNCVGKPIQSVDWGT
jgi:hypothetical protein